MRNILIIPFLFILAQTTFSQTTVSGPLFSNTNWPLSGSPYNVVGDVQVAIGVTLSLEPGVQVNFTGNYQILIKGAIIANGISSSPITFSGNNGGAMMMFKSTNLNNSHLSHIEFTGSQNGIQLADETELAQDPTKNSGLLYINKAIFTNTTIATKGYQTSASLIIDSSDISGTLIKGFYPRSEPIEIRNSVLTGNTINSDSYNYGITLNNCTVSGGSFTIGCCEASFKILKSFVQNSSLTEYNNFYYVDIIETQLINTPIDLPNAARLNISKSSITYNTPYAIKASNVEISCSELVGNGNGTALELIKGGNSIRNSTIKNNTIAIKNDNDTTSIDSSNIFNNSLYNIENNSVNYINASNNWWGTTDPSIISSKIFDYYDNINYGITDFSNNLVSAYALSCPLVLANSVYENPSNQVLSINIYPNPASESVNLQIENNNNEDIEIDISNILGQINYSVKLDKFNQLKTINISTYQKGIYFCRVISAAKTISKKLIIQ